MLTLSVQIMHMCDFPSMATKGRPGVKWLTSKQKELQQIATTVTFISLQTLYLTEIKLCMHGKGKQHVKVVGKGKQLI